jgi:PAP2 superfamily protein
MTDHEAQAAWRLFTLNWLPSGLMALTLVLCLALTDFKLTVEGLLLPFGAAALLAGGAYVYAFARRHEPVVPFALGSIAQLVLITALILPLTYIAAAANLPMQDANLAFLDRMLGLDWQAYFNFIYDRPALIPYEYLGYAMIDWPMFGIPVALAAARRYRRLQQFTLACALALMVTAVISALLPAIGTYYEYGIQLDLVKFSPGGYLVQLRELPLVRDGSLRVLDIMKLGGIVTFPSVHAAAAVLYLWALWSVWWMRPLALIANVGMLLTTPMGGGHYFVDVFAGMGVAVLAIAAACRISGWLTRPVAQRMGATAAVPAAAYSEP